MSVDLESLRLLVLIEETGSLGAAARRLGVTQPAASARLRSLETRHQLQLVARSPRGSQLTDDGQAVCTWARAVLAEVEQLQAGLAALSTQRRGDLKVAASLTIAEHLMPSWLSELHAMTPGVHAGLTVANSADVLDLVRTSQVRLGFIESPAQFTDLNSCVVGFDHVAVVVRPDHPWAHRSTAIKPDEIASNPLVVREEGSGTRDTLDMSLPTPPNIAMVANSTIAVLGAAQGGLAPGVVSEIAARHAIVTGQLVEVDVDVDLTRPLRAVWRANERLRPPLSDLVDIATVRSGA